MSQVTGMQGSDAELYLTVNYILTIIIRFVWLIHCQGQIRSSGSLALVSKGGIQPIILCRSAQECRGELSLCWGTDRFITLLSAVSWARTGQQWKAASLSAEDIKPCLAERSKSWWLPPPSSSFPFPFPIFSHCIKSLYSSSGSCTPKLLQLWGWFLLSTFWSIRQNVVQSMVACFQLMEHLLNQLCFSLLQRDSYKQNSCLTFAKPSAEKSLQLPYPKLARCCWRWGWLFFLGITSRLNVYYREILRNLWKSHKTLTVLEHLLF